MKAVNIIQNGQVQDYLKGLKPACANTKSLNKGGMLEIHTLTFLSSVAILAQA